MGILKPKYLKSKRSKNIKVVSLAEALGHASACDLVLSAAGKITLPKGSMIDPHTISRLAAQGIDRVPVYRKPRISIVVIGNGLISPGLPQALGKTYDFSCATLSAALETMRIRPVFMRRLMNEPKILKKVISFAFNQSDIIILVAKEIEQGLGWIRRLKGPDADTPRVFFLSYDLDLILEDFYEFIQPAIQAFMGCTQPKDSACGMS